jgi:dihydrofolate reductase
MRLVTYTQVTVDGVMQGNGGATHEEERNGFTRGGWAMGVFGDETAALITKKYESADAFLFGRSTYDVFAGSWGTDAEMRAHPIGMALNTKPKYVASNTLSNAPWADTTVLSGDVEAAIRTLKAAPGGELQVHGSGALIRWLLERDLVDEMTLLIVPVVVGQGTRLFADNGPDIALEAVHSRVDSKGVTTQVYRPNGRPQYRPSLPDHLK